MSRVLVLGGTGWVGRAVVARLAAEGHDVVFTWHTNATLAAELPGRAVRVDLREVGALTALAADADALVQCAGVPAAGTIFDAAEQVSDAVRVHVGALFEGVAAMARRPSAAVRNVVAFGALAPGQSFPVAPHFAAAQGGLAAAAMALGHALGPQGFRVNVVALGVLDGGAANAVSPEQVAAYTRFSALRRVGTAAEAAATAVWLVRENRVLNGRVIAANGGV